MTSFKEYVLALFVKLIPQEYYPALMRELQENSPSGNVQPEFQLMDYPKSAIYVFEGIRAYSCRKEPETVRWVENYIKPGQVFFDIGANIGAYSLIAAKYHQGTVKVYAFEPAFQTFPILVKNILRNDCAGIIFPLNFPLAEVQRLAAFNYKSLREGSSEHCFGDQIDWRGEHFQPVFKQFTISTTIDNLIQEYDVPKPNHIKLDVDGLEFSILEGAQATIRGDWFKSLLVEVGGGRFAMDELISFVEDSGLQLSERHEHPATSNYIFCRQPG